MIILNSLLLSFIKELFHKNKYKGDFKNSHRSITNDRMEFKFFTSVRVPSGSPGLCTEMLASTRREPSVR